MKHLTCVDAVVVHCSRTPPDQDIGVKEIESWHLRKGLPKIGYHFVIRRNGKVEIGRKEKFVGAHVPEYNQRSLGICLVGGVAHAGYPEVNFTQEQSMSLKDLLLRLLRKYPGLRVYGHCELEVGHDYCPTLDMKKWLVKEGLEKPWPVRNFV
jgi:N-acetylmuramoyl-L-alanine amidase